MVRILGGFQTDFARNWKKEGKHVAAPMTEVILGSLEATKLDPADIGTIHVGNFAGELYTMQGHMGALALEASEQLRGKPTARHEAACASGSMAVLAATAELEAGRYETALVVGVEQMKTVRPADGGEFLGTAGWYERESKGLDFPFPRLFGKLGAEYMMRFEIEQGRYEDSQAYLSDLMYRHARNNPNAQTRSWEMSYEQARGEDEKNFRISPEIKVSDCSQVTDGAAALVLASEDYAHEYAKERGIDVDSIPSVLGWGHTTAPLALADKLEESRGQEYVLPHARKAITDALGRAGVAGPESLDAYEFHDCFTTTAYASFDLVGLTKPGQNHIAIEEGWAEMDGRLPLNPSGGLIGAGHPVGATGVRQLLDAWRQVTDNAGDYQVNVDEKKVLAMNIGGSGTTTAAFVVGQA